jgi:hypothetical protein
MNPDLEVIRDYESARTSSYLLFADSSARIASIIAEIIPDLNRLKAHLDELNALGKCTTEMTKVLRLTQGIRTSQLSMQMIDARRAFPLLEEPDPVRAEACRALSPDFEDFARVPLPALEANDGSLAEQLACIRAAALRYTDTDNDMERLLHEHILVRVGADSRDIISDRLPRLSMEVMGHRLFGALSDYCDEYQQVLESYDRMAKLSSPTAEGWTPEKAEVNRQIKRDVDRMRYWRQRAAD